VGMKGIDSDMAPAVRSAVQAAFVIGFCAAIGKLGQISQLVGRHTSMAMILLSGVCGGLSWIFVFRAIQLADVSKVAPIDKLSLPLGILLAVLILKERPTAINWLGILLITFGAYLATVSTKPH